MTVEKQIRQGLVVVWCAAGLSAFGQAIYLKADAAGDGSGRDWANACTSIQAAVNLLNAAPEGSREMRVAQGVYVMDVACTVTAAGFSIRGGYRASENGDLERDPLAYQSIFTPDTDANDCVRPVAVADFASSSQLPLNNIRVVQSGKVFLPDTPHPDTGDYGAYCLFTQSGKNAVTDFLCVADGASGVIDGLVTCGMAEASGTALSIAGGAGDVSVSNCVFAYHGGVSRTEIALGASGGAVRKVANCLFFGISHSWTPIVSAKGGAEIVGCTFSSISSSAATTGRCLVLEGEGNAVRHCMFTRVNATFPGGYAASAVICRSESGTPLFEGCAFDRCSGAPGQTTVKTCPALFAFKTGGTLQGCAFTRCRICAYARPNGCYALTASSLTGAHVLKLRSCRFLSNSLRIVPQTSDVCRYLVGTVGNAADGQSTEVSNCVFDGTAFSCEPSDVAVPLVARAAFAYAGAANSKSALTFVNNTVVGPRDEGAYDIVQRGAWHTCPLAVWNSIFAEDAFVHKDVFWADVPGLLDVRCCTVKNMTEAYWPSGIDVSTVFSSDDIPLDEDYTPAVRTPLIRETTDGSVRGAVNALTASAEAGYALTVRCDPVSGVSLSTPATQTVAPDALSLPVTATGLGGATVRGWYEADGETLVTESDTLPPLSLTADRVVVMKLKMPEMRFTFDLGACGTFDETGLPTIEVRAPAGSAFPSVPLFTIDEERWAFLGWDAPFPTVTPSSQMTFRARYVTTSLRTVRVVPSHTTPPAETNGMSWATAYTDLAAAYRDAAAYRGEVWVASGAYALPATIPMLSRVCVRGGFAGTETSAAEADPAARRTVLTIQGDVFSATSGTVEDPAFDGLVFRNVKGSAIKVNGAAVTGLAISRCTFENCNTQKAPDYGVVGFNACDVTLKDCLFTNSHHCAYFDGTAPGTASVVDGCRFVGNSGMNYGTCLYIGGKGALTVTNSVFVCNTNTTHNCMGSATVTVSSDSTRHRLSDCLFASNAVANTCEANILLVGGALLERCRFVGNVLTAKNTAASSHSAALTTGGPRTTVRDCSFVGNRVETAAASSTRSVVICGANRTTFANCTFDGNAVVRALDDPGTLATVWFKGHNQNVAFCHCTLSNSALADGCAEVDCRNESESASYGNCALSFVNSVFWNAAAGYRPVDLGGKDISLWVQQSALKNLDLEQYTASTFLCEGLETALDPRLLPCLKTGANGLPARPLSGLSPVRRAGAEVWSDPATGLVYAYDAGRKAYHELTSVRNVSLPSGLTAESPLMTDAWGAPRTARRIALGAVNAEAPGLRILVR